jgi:hypothetical protein
MSGRQKALLAVLAVALVALFVIAVGTGSGDRGDPDARGGVVGWLGRLGGDRSAVDPATVTADCSRSGDGFAFTGDCLLTVEDPGGLRTLLLRSPATFGVHAPAPGDADVTVEDEVEPSPGAGAVARIAVDKRTEVRLTCPGLGSCTVTVAPS